MKYCPNCETELELEEDGLISGCCGEFRPGFVLYCPDCGYQERHIRGMPVEYIGVDLE